MNKFKNIILIILPLIFLFSFSITSYADESYGYQKATEVFKMYGYGNENENGKITKFLKEDYNPNKGYTTSVTLEDGIYWYNPEQEEEIIKIGNELDRKLLYAKNDKNSMRRFNDSTNDKRLYADSEKATFILDGFIDVVSYILGFIVLAISVGITLTTALDIAFIALPVWRGNLYRIPFFRKRKNQDGDNKIRIVSDDAQYAVLQAETIRTGVNPLMIYFKGRILTYMVLAVLLYILIDGKVVIIAQWALRLVGGIINILGQIG